MDEVEKGKEWVGRNSGICCRSVTWNRREKEGELHRRLWLRFPIGWTKTFSDVYYSLWLPQIKSWITGVARLQLPCCTLSLARRMWEKYWVEGVSVQDSFEKFSPRPLLISRAKITHRQFSHWVWKGICRKIIENETVLAFRFHLGICHWNRNY